MKNKTALYNLYTNFVCRPLDDSHCYVSERTLQQLRAGDISRQYQDPAPDGVQPPPQGGHRDQAAQAGGVRTLPLRVCRDRTSPGTVFPEHSCISLDKLNRNIEQLTQTMKTSKCVKL